MILKKIALLFNLLIFGTLAVQGQLPELTIIPKPLESTVQSGTFKLTKSVSIVVDKKQPELLKIAEMLQTYIQAISKQNLTISDNKTPNSVSSIQLKLSDQSESLGKEGYRLQVTPSEVTLEAYQPNGMFYAMQTLTQLLTSDAKALQAATITDKPRFEWRGMMLDVGRYFYGMDFLKKYIDYMAMHKFNTFHWHLTEDHGWRIEIKKHPELTQVGAWRAGTQYGKNANEIDHNPHGGFYTQEQVKELVAYAQARYITIVPEIEMPGHSLSALATYPELSCTGGPFQMPVAWGIQKDVYCAGNEKTYQFLEDVLSEVADLFPSPIIHIGGDECPKDRWKACPKCQAKIRSEHLKDEHELQSYFIKRIEDFLLTKNKRIIGWDEILEGGLAPNATVMSWRGIDGGIAAAKQHHDVVMTPTDYLYFDYYQGEPYLEPLAIGGFVPLSKVYNYEPVPEQLTKDEAQYIKGVQGNVWSEFIHSPERVEYMAFPRAAALAEIAWSSPENKNWPDFQRRMVAQYKRYDQLDINYSKSAFQVTIQEKKIDGKQAEVTLSAENYHPEIRYTTDGTTPNSNSAIYQGPFSVKIPSNVKAVGFENGRKVGEASVRAVGLAVTE
ncbi:glycoside hydrolase family 20 protein [Olivibacter ginsenosidimutans]|uniref:beta-N-acetylhexosaminidase n=1 Tax=Olivibacter ginsenosidimutans TaxID=1176537 RepID=A0ABP9CE39_9SPHI